MSKKKIVVLSVLIPFVVLVIIAVSVAFASRPRRPGPRHPQMSVSETFNNFSKTFILDDSHSQREDFKKLGDIRHQLGTVPGIIPGTSKDAGIIGCDSSFCVLKLTFASTADLDRFATNHDALKDYRDWSGPKFSMTLSPKNPVNNQSPPGGYAQLILGMGAAGLTHPTPSSVVKEANLVATAGATSCKWSEAKNERHSLQLSASACAGSIAASFPNFANDDPLGGKGTSWESLHMHAFMPVTLPPSMGGTTLSVPMTQGGSANNDRSVLVCPVPYETSMDSNATDTSVPTRLCATVALFTNDSRPSCRIHWIASRGDDAANLIVERFSGAQRAPGQSTGVKVTNPIVDDIDPTWYQFFDINPASQMTELTGMDVLCLEMQKDDRVVRYRFDYEVTQDGP